MKKDYDARSRAINSIDVTPAEAGSSPFALKSVS